MASFDSGCFDRDWVERLGANRALSGIECLETLLHDLGRGGDESLRAGGCDILRLLRARDAIIGTTRTPPTSNA